MVKIKSKVQKNLPQLIEYAWDNDMRNKNFESEGGAIVYFDYDGNLTCARGFVPQDFFTVTTEEELTEDTELDLIERFIGGMGYSCYTTHRMTIKDCLRRSPEECTTTHFYIENDDRELILIWRDGKLVE